MNSLLNFAMDPHVQSTILGSMAVTALLKALPVPGTKLSRVEVYRFFYNFLLGWWSLRTGQTVNADAPGGAAANPTNHPKDQDLSLGTPGTK
jgi:hypothetical protein